MECPPGLVSSSVANATGDFLFELGTVAVTRDKPARHLDVSSLDLRAPYEGECDRRTEIGSLHVLAWYCDAPSSGREEATENRDYPYFPPAAIVAFILAQVLAGVGLVSFTERDPGSPHGKNPPHPPTPSPVRWQLQASGLEYHHRRHMLLDWRSKVWRATDGAVAHEPQRGTAPCCCSTWTRFGNLGTDFVPQEGPNRGGVQSRNPEEAWRRGMGATRGDSDN